MKYKNTVFVLNEHKFVTGITDGQYALWEDGKEPLTLTLSRAKDICEGLNSNLIPAAVVLLPEFINLKNSNTEKEEGEDNE